jgi:cytochrome c peroxidase
VRNVGVGLPDITKAFGHNGYFKSLDAIVHFYNTRDTLPRCETTKGAQPGVNCWPAPEVDTNVEKATMGDLGLTADEEQAIVAFLKTLSDGYVASGGSQF